MKMKINQKGFSLIEGVIVVVVLVAIAGAGYYVYHKDQKSVGNAPISSANTTHTAYLGYKSPSTATQVAPNITSASDLSNAYQVLNQTSVSANNVDSAQLQTQSSSF